MSLDWPGGPGPEPASPVPQPEPRPTGPSYRTIVAVGVVLFGGTLMAIGMHHVIQTGTCSSTGYSEYGPVPTCPSGTGLFILYLVGGIFLTVGGGLAGGGASAFGSGGIVFLGIGLGSLSVAVGPWAKDGGDGFGLVFGGCFAFGGLIWVWSSVKLRSGFSSVATVVRTLPTRPAAFYRPPSRDVADEIERLSKLHGSGALTDEEFAQAKARALRGS
ncbi:MAG: hypothetical protein QOF76_5425 [Solirubrobacteraceae bacterium]|nr:hypothetical protein [Solirubrobacteraceae bacterium]